MRDDQFLQLPPVEARRFANFAGEPDEGRLKGLYHTRHGIDLDQTDPEEITSMSELTPHKASPGLEPWAFVLLGLGALLVVIAFFFDVGVGSGSRGLYGIPERVANVDKIAVRHMLLNSGLACFICGWVLVGAEHVAKAVRRSSFETT